MQTLTRRFLRTRPLIGKVTGSLSGDIVVVYIRIGYLKVDFDNPESLRPFRNSVVAVLFLLLLLLLLFSMPMQMFCDAKFWVCNSCCIDQSKSCRKSLMNKASSPPKSIYICISPPHGMISVRKGDSETDRYQSVHFISGHLPRHERGTR